MAARSFAEMGWAGARQARFLALGYVAVLALVLVLLGAVALFGRARDGEPLALFELPPHPRHVARANLPGSSVLPAPRAPTAAAPSQTTPTAPSVPPAIVPSEVRQPVLAGRALVADPSLIESTPDGPLPKVAADGRTPMTAYAPPIPPLKGPRIAIVISGLGFSAKATAAAISDLPGAVTLAFAPYENDVPRWVADARKAGHEVLLEVPMEPFDFPDSDPGPHTLRTAASEESNIQRLTWSLTRFTGYAGVTNLLGERFMADADSLEPVMTFLSRRGLLFFDSSSQGRSAGPDIARRIASPYVQSSLTIDTIQTEMEIDARLSEIERLARLNGSASGNGSLYPVTLQRVAVWAKGLAGRGFVLVPASAIVAPTK